ncbi:MAG: MazG-like family protein [Candidatus Saccharimonadales bacterium]
MSASLADLQKRVEKFVGARDWEQFHDDPKNTILALGGEIGELMEIYRFTTIEQAQKRVSERRTEVEDELADILYNLLLFCSQNKIDLEKAFMNKEQKRESKYPVSKFKGINAKYNEL